jgi:hypothetical protein
MAIARFSAFVNDLRFHFAAAWRANGIGFIVLPVTANCSGQGTMVDTTWDERLLPPASRALIHRFKVTLSVLAIITIVGIYTTHLTAPAFHDLIDHVGVDLDAFQAWHLWTVMPATLVQSSPGIQWHMMLLVTIALGSLEYLAGSAPALVTFIAGDWIASVLTIGALWVMSGIGVQSATELLHTPSTGSSAAAHAAAGAACVLVGGRWGKTALALIIGITLVSVTFQHLDNALVHFIALLAGAAFGYFVWRPRLHLKPTLVREPHVSFCCMEE